MAKLVYSETIKNISSHLSGYRKSSSDLKHQEKVINKFLKENQIMFCSSPLADFGNVQVAVHSDTVQIQGRPKYRDAY